MAKGGASASSCKNGEKRKKGAKGGGGRGHLIFSSLFLVSFSPFPFSVTPSAPPPTLSALQPHRTHTIFFARLLSVQNKISKIVTKNKRTFFFSSHGDDEVLVETAPLYSYYTTALLGIVIIRHIKTRIMSKCRGILFLFILALVKVNIELPLKTHSNDVTVA